MVNNTWKTCITILMRQNMNYEPSKVHLPVLTNGTRLLWPLRSRTMSTLSRRSLGPWLYYLRYRNLTMQCASRAGLSAARHAFLPRLTTPRFSQLRSMSQSRPPVTLLGSMAFGGRADAHLSAQLVQLFLERGHEELDTAFMYNDGQAETIIGNMQLAKTGRRTLPKH